MHTEMVAITRLRVPHGSADDKIKEEFSFCYNEGLSLAIHSCVVYSSMLQRGVVCCSVTVLQCFAILCKAWQCFAGFAVHCIVTTKDNHKLRLTASRLRLLIVSR